MNLLFFILVGLSGVLVIVAFLLVSLRASPYRTESMENFSLFFAKHRGETGSLDFRNVYVGVTEIERKELVFRARVAFILLPVFFLITTCVTRLWLHPVVFWVYNTIGILFLIMTFLTYIRDIPHIRSGKIPVWLLPKGMQIKYMITVWKEG